MFQLELFVYQLTVQCFSRIIWPQFAPQITFKTGRATLFHSFPCPLPLQTNSARLETIRKSTFVQTALATGATPVRTHPAGLSAQF
jgi:hypothetical protein